MSRASRRAAARLFIAEERRSDTPIPERATCGPPLAGPGGGTAGRRREGHDASSCWPDDPEQCARFPKAARAHGADMDKPQFEAALRKVASTKPQRRDEKERKPARSWLDSYGSDPDQRSPAHCQEATLWSVFR